MENGNKRRRWQTTARKFALEANAFIMATTQISRIIIYWTPNGSISHRAEPWGTKWTKDWGFQMGLRWGEPSHRWGKIIQEVGLGCVCLADTFINKKSERWQRASEGVENMGVLSGCFCIVTKCNSGWGVLWWCYGFLWVVAIQLTWLQCGT